MGTGQIPWMLPTYIVLSFLTLKFLYVDSSELLSTGSTYHYISTGSYIDASRIAVSSTDLQYHDMAHPKDKWVNITWVKSSTSSISIAWAWHMRSENAFQSTTTLSSLPAAAASATAAPSSTPSSSSSTGRYITKSHTAPHFHKQPDPSLYVPSPVAFLGWNVEYHLKTGSFMSKMLPPETNSYSLTGLQSNTAYNVCVSVQPHPTYIWPLAKRKSHCLTLWTVPLIRRDSIVGLLLCFGYYALMIGLGVWQWKRRVYLSKRWRRNSIEDHSEDKQSAVVRWRDLDESDEKSRLKD
ncbi:XP_014770855.1PREDICTED: uncharacterized protein LOC106869572 [Octopus vulgaris]|uniref:XP_014770855.1PREDICTED: uncharacterized protein LOC106869572 n=1 Tax=Octopus vulgaris TaxID=6645 RepID=A0AA36BWV5_OCTVU|nr:XP_014770855.1PREDICTED: uncharacterized protein LOC106869572 [Octopus vulgaris]